MLVILEGVDGSGKTTLASKLENLGFSTVRVPKSANLSSLDWRRILELSNTMNMVLDRSWITDIVYTIENPIEHSPWPISLQDIASFTKGALLIHCDSDSAFENAVARGEDKVNTIERHNRIRDLYNDIIVMIGAYCSTCKIIEYDYDDESAYAHVEELIKERLKEYGI